MNECGMRKEMNVGEKGVEVYDPITLSWLQEQTQSTIQTLVDFLLLHFSLADFDQYRKRQQENI